MKKLLCFSLVFIMLCGCTQKTEKLSKITNASFKAEVLLNREKYTLNAEISEGKKLSATVISPKNIKGTCVTVSGEDINVQFMGISYDKKLSDYPKAAIVNLIYEIFLNGEITEGEGEIEGITYSLELSPDGTPQKLVLPELQAKIEFKDVIIKRAN